MLMLMQLKSTQDSLSANKSLSTQIAISAKVSDLIHELQKERGLSAGFLSSRGAKFSSELKSQRNSTDSVLKELKKIASKDLLKGFDLKGGFDALDLLDSTRLNADNSLKGDSPLITQTIGYYTKTISTLLEAIAKSSFLDFLGFIRFCSFVRSFGKDFLIFASVFFFFLLKLRSSFANLSLQSLLKRTKSNI